MPITFPSNSSDGRRLARSTPETRVGFSSATPLATSVPAESGAA